MNDDRHTELGRELAWVRHQHGEDVPPMSFDDIAGRVETTPRRPWWGDWRFAVVPALAVAAAIAMVFVPAEPGGRMKGAAACGPVTIRVTAHTAEGPAALPSRIVSAADDLGVTAALPRDCWVSVHLVALESGHVVSTAPQALPAGAHPIEAFVFSPTDRGRHVLALIASVDRTGVSKMEVRQLLKALGRGEATVLDGTPVSVDLFDLEVAP